MNYHLRQRLLDSQFYRNDFVIIDTCSFLHDHIEEFLKELVGIFKAKRSPNRHLVLHESIVSELYKLSKKSDVGLAANRALNLINNIYSGVFEPAGTDAMFGDASIFRAVIGLRLVGTVLVITEDKNLTHDCLLLNELKSQKGRKITLMSIGDIFRG